MSLLFEALQKLEGERPVPDSVPQPEVEEMLRCVQQRIVAKRGPESITPEEDNTFTAPAALPTPPVAVQALSSHQPQRANNSRLHESSPEDSSPGNSSPGNSSVDNSRIGRTLTAVRTAIPFILSVLDIFDRKPSAAGSALLAPPAPEPPPTPVAPPIDLVPIEKSLVELHANQLNLREQVVEQNASLGRLEDRLEMVRQATDRNTLEQQELVEELRGVNNRINFVAVVVIGLLVVSVALTATLYLHILKVLH